MIEFLKATKLRVCEEMCFNSGELALGPILEYKRETEERSSSSNGGGAGNGGYLGLLKQFGESRSKGSIIESRPTIPAFPSLFCDRNLVRALRKLLRKEEDDKNLDKDIFHANR
jgi:hypothetical protein